MQMLDVLCVLPLVLSIIFGAKSGSVKLMIGFIFFIMSLWLTYLIFPSFGEVLARHMENEFMINFLSIAFAYIMSSLFCNLIASSLKKMTGEASGGLLDRALGTALGAARGVVLSLIIFLAVAVVAGKVYNEAENLLDLVPTKEDEQPDWVKDSFSYDHMMKLTKIAVDVVGEDNLKGRSVPDFVK